jgi:hypothetical protein
MKIPWIVMIACLTIAVSGCGKSKVAASSSIALAEAAVTVKEVMTTAKTPKGEPVRLYEVTPAAATAAQPGMPAAATPRSVIVIVGDAAIPIEICNARHVKVGDKKVEVNLMLVGPAVVKIGAAAPGAGSRVLLDVSVDELLKKAASGKLDIGELDL